MALKSIPPAFFDGYILMNMVTTPLAHIFLCAIFFDASSSIYNHFFIYMTPHGPRAVGILAFDLSGTPWKQVERRKTMVLKKDHEEKKNENIPGIRDEKRQEEEIKYIYKKII